jgi:hypothetical protein
MSEAERETLKIIASTLDELLCMVTAIKNGDAATIKFEDIYKLQRAVARVGQVVTVDQL